MVEKVPERLANKIRTHAVQYITDRGQRQTNLALFDRVIERGAFIGPRHQRIKADRACTVVFADDEPQMNFGHRCRYLVYDAETGEFLREVPARFPPSLRHGRKRLDAFFRPVVIPGNRVEIRWPIPYLCPVWLPEGERYAILFSGCTQGRHLNDMEFCYRTLVNVYGFPPDHVQVLNYDGTLNVWDITLGKWPGDNTAYQMPVTGNGTRAAMQTALNSVAGKIGKDDLLFIHTNNHGDNASDGMGSFLCAFDDADPSPTSDGDWNAYYAADFATDLKVVPAHRALIVMMEQCNSGGFNTPIINASAAASISVSAAATATVSSAGGADWDPFAYQWIAALNGSYPDGSALTYNPDTSHAGLVSARDAYDYAVKEDSYDTPQYDDSPARESLSLSEPFEYVWFWCWVSWRILRPLYERYFPRITIPPNPNPPDPGPYYALVRQAQSRFKEVFRSGPQADLTKLRERIQSELATIVGATAGSSRGRKSRRDD